MPNNLLIKDANGNPREVKTLETGGIHTPVHRAEGPLTNAELRASSVPVSGPVTNTELRAAPVPVLGPLTDTQLRASDLPVTGPVTDVQLRANPVPVSLAAGSIVTATPPSRTPLSCGAYTVSATLLSITPPAGSVGVRLLPVGHHAFFNLNAAPGTQAPNTLAAGGMIWGDEWREVLWTVGSVGTLQLKSDQSVPVQVEFLKQGA